MKCCTVEHLTFTR